MAKFEAEVGCAPSAGDDWRIHLDRVMELALDDSEHRTLPAQSNMASLSSF
jgi:hypothetical protein